MLSTKLIDIIDLTQRESSLIGSYCTHNPVTRTSEVTLRGFYESDFKVLTLVQSSTKGDMDLQSRLETEKIALLANLKSTFEIISQLNEEATLPTIKATKSRLDELSKTFFKLESQKPDLLTAISHLNPQGVLLDTVSITEHLQINTIKLNEKEETALESKKLKETLEKNARDSLCRSLPKGEFHPFKGKGIS